MKKPCIMLEPIDNGYLLKRYDTLPAQSIYFESIVDALSEIHAIYAKTINDESCGVCGDNHEVNGINVVCE